MGFVQLVFLGAICLAQFLGFYGHFITQSSLNSPHPPALMGSLLSSAKPSREIKKNIKKNKNPNPTVQRRGGGRNPGKTEAKKKTTNNTNQKRGTVCWFGWIPPSFSTLRLPFPPLRSPGRRFPGKFLIFWHQTIPQIPSSIPGAAALEVGRGEAEGRGFGGMVFPYFFSPFPILFIPCWVFEGVCKHLWGDLHLVWVLPEIPGSFVQLSVRTKPAAPLAGSASGFSKNKLCIPHSDTSLSFHGGFLAWQRAQ